MDIRSISRDAHKPQLQLAPALCTSVQHFILLDKIEDEFFMIRVDIKDVACPWHARSYGAPARGDEWLSNGDNGKPYGHISWNYVRHVIHSIYYKTRQDDETNIVFSLVAIVSKLICNSRAGTCTAKFLTMKVFLVLAHPESTSLNASLAKYAVEVLEKAGHEVKVRHSACSVLQENMTCNVSHTRYLGHLGSAGIRPLRHEVQDCSWWAWFSRVRQRGSTQHL